MKLAEATVIAIQAAPKGVKPTVKLVGGFFHITLASDDRAGAVTVTVKQVVPADYVEQVCKTAAATFARLPKAKSTA